MKKTRRNKNQQKQSNKLMNRFNNQSHKTMETNHLKKYQVPKLNNQFSNQQPNHKISKSPFDNPLESLSKKKAMSV